MDRTVEQLTARVAANPFDGEAQAELARRRFAAGDVAAARELAEAAAELGAGEFGELLLLAARCAGRLGQIEEARNLLVDAMAAKLRDLELPRTDPDFAELRADPAIRQLLGIADEPLDRDAGWRFDLAFFAQEVRRRAVDPFGLIREEDYDSAVRWLEHHLPALSEARILLELDRLLVPLRDGHAYVAPAPERTDLLAALPLAFARFEEGTFINAANAEYADLAGCELIAIDGTPIAEVTERLWSTICRDNEQWPNELIPFRLREPALLHAMGIAAASDRLLLSVRDDDGLLRERQVVADDEFPTAPLGRNFPFPDDWVTPLDRLTEKPLYLRDLRTPFWSEQLLDLDAVYLQLNAVRDGDEETLAVFAERFFDLLDETLPARLIIDIRMNKGGNTSLEWPFLHRLFASRWNARGKLFVIIGRRTFSAAQNFATYLDLHTNAIFVGEPTGSSPTFNGESVEFTLPCSGTRVNISDLLWQSGWPWDRRPWIPPDLYAPPTFAAFREGRDVCLEAISQEIATPTLTSSNP
ncbi:MAG TPA: hypothetical protein VFP05_08675 [Thermomicrobiales bacterium]|nr:hypothetical protein [Thermomicrobiales bacterium]